VLTVQSGGPIQRGGVLFLDDYRIEIIGRK
jgi:hypothetical protein